GLAVDALLLGLHAVDPHVGVAALPDAGSLAVAVLGLVSLIDGAAVAHPALFFDHVLQVALGGDVIAEHQRTLPLVVRPAPDRVHTGEPVGEPGRPGSAQDVHRVQHDAGAEEPSPSGLPGVLLVRVEGRQVADRVRQVPDGVARDLRPPRLAAGEGVADCLPDARDALVRDLAVLVGHVPSGPAR